MHYAITYDIESDRLRTLTAKTVERFGGVRVQRSVFVVANMEKRHLTQLQAALQRLLNKRLQSGESRLILPLREEHVAEIQIIGHNNILTNFEPPPTKILL